MGVPPLLYFAAMVIVIVAAALSGLLAGRHVVATPLSVTVRANRRPPRWYAGLLLVAPGLLVVTWWPVVPFLRDGAGPLIGAVIMAIGLLLFPSWLVWFSARTVERRAHSAETLLAARALEADPRAWDRALSIVGLAVAIGSASGWIEAEMLMERRASEPFWLSSFILIDLALLVGMAVAASALLVHQAEYLLERGPVLATLQATGTPETALRRVLVRQALIAATPVCAIAALAGLLSLGLGVVNSSSPSRISVHKND